MRQLNKSEQFLATFLGLAIFIVGNMAAISHMLALGRTLNTKRSALNEQKLVADAWLAQSTLWGAREQWLQAARPAFTKEITPATLVRQMQDLSKANGVKILDQNLLESADVTGCHTFSIHLRLSGQLEQMVAWLHDLQTPSSFVECTAFVCHQGVDSAEMEWEITLTRYYSSPKA